MDVMIEYEADEKFDFDYEKVICDIVEEALEQYACPYEAEVSVTITDNAGIHEVNRQFRSIDRATDVLSFPMIEYEKPGDFTGLEDQLDVFNPDTGNLMLGDIMISRDKVAEQAQAYGHGQVRELAFLVAHSMLHLFGFDHIQDAERKDMEKRQERILQSKGYTRVDSVK